MEAEQKPPETPASADSETPAPQQAAPPDALGKSEEAASADTPPEAAGGPDLTSSSSDTPAKKPSGLKAFFKRFNVYLLLFILVVVIAVIVSVLGYLSSKKPPATPDLATQQLTSDALKQLANSDATVGNSGQTLTVQGNAIFAGQVLVRSDLNVAGAIKLGGDLTAQNFTASGNVNLANTQANSLQVASGTTLQGTVTVQHDLNVGGTSVFSGPITAGQVTVTKLIMAGNAQLQVPNHIAFTGASPTRTIDTGVLGAAGSASVDGSDTTGTVNINTGTGTSPGCFIAMTFNRPFTTTPHVLVTPVNSGAGQLQYYVKRSTTGFSICTLNAAPAQQNFAFDYFITD
jgi:cytoskeletal protein CcmA (bactofilin family)